MLKWCLLSVQWDVLVFGFFIVLCNASFSILTPILSVYYQSLYFLLSWIIFEIVLLLLLLFFILLKWTQSKPLTLTKHHHVLIIFSGFVSAVMNLSQTYSANPDRAPIFIQILLSGFSIILTMTLKRIYIKQSTVYNIKYICLSLFFLAVTISLSIYPLIQSFQLSQFLWILLYMFSILSLCSFAILQEKIYLLNSTDTKIGILKNIMNVVYINVYCRSVNLAVQLCSIWIEYILGYQTDNVINNIVNSFNMFIQLKSPFILLQVFVPLQVLGFISIVYVSCKSSTYNITVQSLSTPFVLLFFKVFSQFNTGKTYEWYIIIAILITSLLTTGLWLKGETLKENEESIDEKSENNDSSDEDNSPNVKRSLSKI
jgi:hypothetical protein